MSDCLGFTYSFGAIDFGGLVPAIQQHRFDFSVPDAYLTPPRLAVVRFVAYISAAERVVVPHGNPKGIKTTLDLCGLIGTSQPGAADALILQHLTEQCVAAGKPAVVVQNYSMGSQDFQAVAVGHADFHIDGESVYSGFNNANPGVLDIVLEPFTGADQGMVFPQDSTDLTQAILAATRAVQEDGLQLQFIKKWQMQGVVQKDGYIAPALP
jgi:polar amino acid transport system substrate-binding protein